MTASEADTIEVGDQVRFKLCDSSFIHEAEVLDIEFVTATSIYSPGYRIFVVKDAVSGWTNRLHAKDLR
jgi:hypothetical protein